MEPKNCPSCGKAPCVDKDYGWTVCCRGCYDGAPDAGRQQIGVDIASRDAAVASWNEQVEDAEWESAGDEESERDRVARDREIDRGIDEARGK